MNDWQVGFDIGRAFAWFELRVKEREEVLIHQSCDTLLDLLDRISRDTEEIEKPLKKIKDVVEYNNGDIEDASFWLFINDRKAKIKRNIRGLI